MRHLVVNLAGFQDDDWDVLIEALHAGTALGQAPRHILDSLHSVNDHSACQWKDYFLENHSAALAAVNKLGPGSFRSQSESPPPPTNVVTFASGRCQFTPEDVSYITALAEHLCKHGQKLSSFSEFCEILAGKAPHHTARSWCKYIYKHKHIHTIIREICGVRSAGSESNAQTQEDQEDSREDFTHGVGHEIHENINEAETESSDIESDPEGIMDIDRPGDAAQDVRQLGNLGDPYNGSDLRTLARFVASTPEWSQNTLSENIRSFHSKYQTRTLAGWMECYRGRRGEIDRLAKQFKREWRRKQKKRALSVSDTDFKARILVKERLSEEPSTATLSFYDMLNGSPKPSGSKRKSSTSCDPPSTLQNGDSGERADVNGDGNTSSSKPAHRTSTHSPRGPSSPSRCSQLIPPSATSSSFSHKRRRTSVNSDGRLSDNEGAAKSQRLSTASQGRSRSRVARDPSEFIESAGRLYNF